MARRSTAKVAGQPAKQSAVGKVKTTASKAKAAVDRVKTAATNIKAAVENEIIPEVVDSARAIQSITEGSYTPASNGAGTATTGISGGYTRGSSGLPDPSSLQIRGLDKIAPLLDVDPFDVSSFAAAGHVEMSKPDYDVAKQQLEGYSRRIETVALGMKVLKDTLKLAASGAEVETAKLDYAVKYQGIETKGVELEIAQSGTRQKQAALDKEMQKENYLAGENVTTGQMLSMKLQKLSLLAQQQSADLLQTRQQTQAMIGNSQG